jgi:hypothetical protein
MRKSTLKKIKQEKLAAQQAKQVETETLLQRIERKSHDVFSSVHELVTTDDAIGFFYNDGECALAFLGSKDSDENEDADFLQFYFRDEMNEDGREGGPPLTRKLFRVFFPLNESIANKVKSETVQTLREMVYQSKGFAVPETKIVKPEVIPHYTQESVLALFKSNDPRIRPNFYGTGRALELSQEAGYFQYDEDDNGDGIVTFTADGVPLFTASVELNDTIRTAKCEGVGCECQATWRDIVYNCHCKHHHEGENHDVLPRFELCNETECDGQHVHLVGMCDVCFYADVREGKSVTAASADNISIQIVEGAPATAAAA